MKRLTAFILCLAALQFLLAAAEPPQETRMVREVFSIVGREFAHQERIDPIRLAEGALHRAAQQIPSLLYTFESQTETPRLRLQAGGRSAQFDLSGLEGLEALEALLLDILKFLLPEDFSQFLPEDAAARTAQETASALLQGMLDSLDPYSSLLGADAYGYFQSRTPGRMGGVGLVLGRERADLTVEATLPGSPAYKAGLRPGDRILQIDHRPDVQLRMENLHALLRGRIGTTLNLLVWNRDIPAPRWIGLERQDLPNASVKSTVFSEGRNLRIGYLRLLSFQDSTSEELRMHLLRLRPAEPGLLGIVLDMRGNHGGVLGQAIHAADLFLERGIIVTMRGPRIDPETVPARGYRSMTAAPLVVLTDRGTASAAEIVAGALKRNHRALLIGTPTFGKNSIQSVFPLSDGHAIKLTVASFFPVGEAAIAGAGIVPNVTLAPVRAVARTSGFQGLLPPLPRVSRGSAPAMRPASRSALVLPHLDAHLDAHLKDRLPGDRRDTRRESHAHPPPLPHRNGRQGGPGGELDATGDFIVKLARKVLRFNRPGDKSSLISNALEMLRQEARIQERSIGKMLAQSGIDWSPGGVRGGQVELLRVDLETRNGRDQPWKIPDGDVRGGEELRLILTLHNASPLPVHRVLAALESPGILLEDLQVPVGRLAPGGSAKAVAVLTLPRLVPQGREALRVRLFDGRGVLHYRTTLFLPLRTAPTPRLRIELAALEDGTGGSSGNGDGRPRRGETLALRVHVQNLGGAPTGFGRYWLSGARLSRLDMAPFSRAFSSLAPGAAHTDHLLFPLPADMPLRPLELRLNLMFDALPSQRFGWPFTLAPHKPLPAAVLTAPAVWVEPLPETRQRDRLLLRGAVESESGTRDIRVYRNGHKIYYQRADEGAANPSVFAASIPLSPGRNLVRVTATDRNGLIAEKSLLFWRGGGAGFPVTGLTR